MIKLAGGQDTAMIGPSNTNGSTLQMPLHDSAAGSMRLPSQLDSHPPSNDNTVRVNSYNFSANYPQANRQVD